MAIRLGQDAPQISADGISGDGNSFVKFDLKANCDAGKWTVLYFYPFDWTPVCQSEINEFDGLLGQFNECQATVVACSTDSKFSHKEWLQSGKMMNGGKTVNHLVISDLTKNISRDYGVLNEAAGFSFRGTVIIDAKGKIRHYSVNEALIGRNPDETLRILRGLQHVDAGKGACMVNWGKK